MRPEKLNGFRMQIINDINKNKNLRKLYYQISREYLDILLGNIRTTLKRKDNIVYI